MKYRISTLLILLVFIPVTVLQAQEITVSGTVEDENNLPLPGVNIVLKNKMTGVITDAQGAYTIDCLPSDTLVFSSIGYTTEEVHIGTKREINISLKPSTVELQDVVVVGYGTQRKESVVGAISQASGEDVVRVRNTSDLTNSLTGLIPGLSTIQTTGQPGGSGTGGDDTQMYIRGKTTWNGDAEPLVLIDGVERSLSDIEPNEVENISVLKDASATAVFGVKGGNGVILVTTKRGTLGKPMMSFSSTVIATSPSKTPSQLESYDARWLKNQAIEYELPVTSNETSWDWYTPEQEMEFFRNNDYPNLFPNTKWSDLLLETGLSQKYNFNVSGGTNFLKYFASLSYLSEDDIVKTTDFGQGYDPGFTYNRYNFRSNLDFSLTKTTTFTMNLSGYYGSQQEPGAGVIGNNIRYLGFWEGLYTTPTDLYPVTYEDGTIANNASFVRYPNPVLGLNFFGYNIRNRSEVNSDFKIKQELDQITKGLVFSAVLSYDNSFLTTGPNVLDYGVATKYINPMVVYMGENEAYDDYVSYQYPRRYMESTHGYEYDKLPLLYSSESASNSSLIRRLQYQASLNYNRLFGEHEIGAMAVFQRREITAGSNWTSFREDWVGRVTYNYASKYFLEANAAYNGSEKFSEEYRFGFFPSMAVGYNLAREGFFNNWLPIFNNFKIRYSNGKSGSDAGADKWAYISSYDLTSQSIMLGYPNVSWSYGINREGVIANPGARWETAHKQNLGIEMAIMKNLFQLNIDLFKEHRYDMYISSEDRVVPSYFGISPPGGNLGELKSEGLELEFKVSKAFSPDLHFRLSAIYTYVRDEVVYKEDPELSPDYQKEAGFSLSQPRTLVNWGIMQDWDDVYTNTPGENTTYTLPGDFGQIDFNADGVINDEDIIPYGYPLIPQSTFTLFTGLSYKNFSLNLQFYGVTNVSRNLALNAFTSDAVYSIAFPIHIEESWLPAIDQTEDATLSAVRLGSNSTMGNRWLVDASYIRLKNAEIAYTLEDARISQFGIDNVRFFVSGNNVFIWTKMAEDKEGGSFSNVNYPITKSYSFGININF